MLTTASRLENAQGRIFRMAVVCSSSISAMRWRRCGFNEASVSMTMAPSVLGKKDLLAVKPAEYEIKM